MPPFSFSHTGIGHDNKTLADTLFYVQFLAALLWYLLMILSMSFAFLLSSPIYRTLPIKQKMEKKSRHHGIN